MTFFTAARGGAACAGVQVCQEVVFLVLVQASKDWVFSTRGVPGTFRYTVRGSRTACRAYGRAGGRAAAACAAGVGGACRGAYSMISRSSGGSPLRDICVAQFLRVESQLLLGLQEVCLDDFKALLLQVAHLKHLALIALPKLSTARHPNGVTALQGDKARSHLGHIATSTLSPD